MTLLSECQVWYKMGEAAGNSRADSIGSNHLAEVNGPIAAAAGKIGDAADLEASSSQYLSAASAAALQWGNVDRYLSCWVRAETLASFPVIAGKGWTTGGTTEEFILYYDTTSSWFVFGVGMNVSGTTTVNASNFGAASTGVWYHLFCYHDAANDLIGISVNDGTPNTAAWANGVNAGAADFSVGNSIPQSLYWDGLIDLFGIFNGSDFAARRAQLYNAGAGLDHPFSAGAVGLVGRGLVGSNPLISFGGLVA